MSEFKKIIPAETLSERCQQLLEKLPLLTTPEDILQLAADYMDLSCYVYDAHGLILAHSNVDGSHCGEWLRDVENGFVQKKSIKSLLSPMPVCNVMPDNRCSDSTCTRMSFPLSFSDDQPNGGVCFFFWNRQADFADQSLAAMVTGALSALYRRGFSIVHHGSKQKQQLFIELLDYKPGLKSYYEHMIQRNLGSPGVFHVLCFNGAADDGILARLNELPDVISLRFKGDLLAICQGEGAAFSAVSEEIRAIAQAADLDSCVSIAFSDLLTLRRIYEDTRSALLAGVAAGNSGMLRAERFLVDAFLSRCRRYFSLDDYCPNGFA